MIFGIKHLETLVCLSASLKFFPAKFCSGLVPGVAALVVAESPPIPSVEIDPFPAIFAVPKVVLLLDLLYVLVFHNPLTQPVTSDRKSVYVRVRLFKRNLRRPMTQTQDTKLSIDSKERVAFDLMMQIHCSAQQSSNPSKEYWLALYHECYRAVLGAEPKQSR